MTYLAWQLELDYGIDRKIYYASKLAQQSFPVSYYCYYTADTARTIANSVEYMDQDWGQLLQDTAYEMPAHTDAGRRIHRMATEVYPQRIAEGQSGFLNKDWYVIG